MSGEIRRLGDRGGVLAAVIDSLHPVSEQLAGLSYAIVGGLAVLIRVPGHRVTEDIDSAIRGRRRDIEDRLKLVAQPRQGMDITFETPTGVPVDVLIVKHRSPRPGIGARREAKAHALGWAIDTAATRTVGTQPESAQGPVTIPVTEPAPLVALKCISAADPRRGDKRGTDLLDIWRLLAADPVATAGIVDNLAHAPGNVADYVTTRLSTLFQEDPASFVTDMAPGPRADTSVEDVRDLWTALVEPGLKQ